MSIAIKRIYEPAAKDDGFRVLVDRVWPRGVSKEEAALDLWDKELAPSTALRKAFNHEPDRWEGFQRDYRRELEPLRSALKALLEQAGERRLTLLYGAKDEAHNQAVVLKAVLEEVAKG